MSCACLYVCRALGRRAGGGVERYSLIPEENVEEINLNYKDEASLESRSGKDTEGKGGGWVGSGWRSLLLFCSASMLFLYFFSFLWEWGGLFSFLSDLTRLPSTSYVSIFYQLLSTVVTMSTKRTPQQRPPLLVLSSHRQQMSWFLREQLYICWAPAKDPLAP